jgi:DNA-directed RNA polymerase specialized sigma24 family protein
MTGLTDIELLDAYARDRSEEAFRELVARHVDFIYSAAMRQLRNPHLAQEATQSAFRRSWPGGCTTPFISPR